MINKEKLRFLGYNKDWDGTCGTCGNSVKWCPKYGNMDKMKRTYCMAIGNRYTTLVMKNSKPKWCPRKLEMIKKGFLISVFSMFILTQSVFGKSIMEEYFRQGNYTYIINRITDVVYIRYEEDMAYWQEINYLIPMYKADGSLMTGEEFKKIMEEGDF